MEDGRGTVLTGGERRSVGLGRGLARSRSRRWASVPCRQEQTQAVPFSQGHMSLGLWSHGGCVNRDEERSNQHG